MKTADALIHKVMAEHPGHSAVALSQYYEAVHQELAPLARNLETALRELLATIELHTDCMDGRIDRAALDPYIERAEELLGESLEEIVK